MNDPIISLCLPTNGVIEWVFPVLESIYSQGVGIEKFEVVVTDNGKNYEFKAKMKEYAACHANLIYNENNAFLFDNQLEALKLAKGKYLKLINHRGIFQAGALEYMIGVVDSCSETKPVIFFANGTMKSDIICDDFDQFVKELGIYASWTTGVGIWKDDYEKIPKDKKYDRISPHSGILFSEKKKDKYIIDNRCFAKDITNDHSQKGNYDLFKAFGIEEFTITLNLFIEGSISGSTLKKVKNDYKKFVSSLYWDFCIRKKPCSYDLSGFDEAMGIFFNKKSIIIGAYMEGLKRIKNKITV